MLLTAAGGLLLACYLALAPQEATEGSAASAGSSALLKPSQPASWLVVGASGATGKVLVSKLASNPRVSRINAIVRKELPLSYWSVAKPEDAAKIEQTVVDFNRLDDFAPAFNGFDVAASCLGSTRAKAGSAAEFRRQDFDTNAAAAALARRGGVFHYALVSTGGADPTSRFNYLRTKGELEERLKAEHFPSLSIFRPGLLLTERQNESRWGEWLAQKILPVLHPLLSEKNRAVHTETVAEAIMQNAEHVLATREQAQAAQGGAGQEGAAAAASPFASSPSRTFENDEIRTLRVARL